MYLYRSRAAKLGLYHWNIYAQTCKVPCAGNASILNFASNSQTCIYIMATIYNELVVHDKALCQDASFLECLRRPLSSCFHSRRQPGGGWAYRFVYAREQSIRPLLCELISDLYTRFMTAWISRVLWPEFVTSRTRSEPYLTWNVQTVYEHILVSKLIPTVAQYSFSKSTRSSQMIPTSFSHGISLQKAENSSMEPSAWVEAQMLGEQIMQPSLLGKMHV